MRFTNRHPHHRLPAGGRRRDDGRRHGKLTGRPGICFVTRGPGATNASHGIHIAMHDSSPLILFIGQVAAHARTARPSRRSTTARFFGDIAKWVVEIDDPARIPELVSRAFARRDLRPARPGGDRRCPKTC